MHLAGISFEGYRCLTGVDLRFDRQVLLIGGNGAGKTSVLEAIDSVFGAGRRSYGFTQEDLGVGADHLSVEFEIRPDDEPTFTPEEHALFETHVDLDENDCEVVRIRVAAGFEDDDVFRARGVFVKEDGEEDGVLDGDTRSSIAFFYLPATRDARREFDDRGGLWARLAMLLERADDPERVDALTAAAGRDLVEAVLGEDRLAELAERVEDFVEVMYDGDLQAELRATAIDFRTLLRRTALLVGSEGAMAPLDRHSTGLQSLALFGLFSAYLETAGGHLLAAGLEEPEVHLAPHVARSLVARAASTGHQVLFTTHAAMITDRASVADIRVLRREGDESVARTLAPTLFDEEELARLQRELTTVGTEFLFARSVLLCEGASELGAIPEFATKLDVSLDRLGVSIASVGGGGFKPFMKLLGDGAFEIPHVVLCDNDRTLKKLIGWLNELNLLPSSIDSDEEIGTSELDTLREYGYFTWSNGDLETYLVAAGGYAHFEAAADFLYGRGKLAAFRRRASIEDDSEAIRKFGRLRQVRKPELAAECARRFDDVPSEMQELIQRLSSLAAGA